MKRTRQLMSIGTLTGIMAIGILGGTAGAQTPSSAGANTPRPVKFVGRVDSVSTNSMALTTRRGQATANVGPNTWILVQRDGGRCMEGTLQDIQTTKLAVVSGMSTTQSGVINARVVTQGRCSVNDHRAARKKQAAKYVAMGTIKAISGSTLTVVTERGPEATVNTTADTVVLNGGFKTTGSLKVGDKIEVLGAPVKPADKAGNTQRSINAWGIRVFTSGSGIVTGRVKSINGNTATLITPRNRAGLTVTLDGTTAYKALAREDTKVTLTNAAQADVKAGSNMIVEGMFSSDGKTITAKSVILLPQAKDRAAKPNKPAKP